MRTVRVVGDRCEPHWAQHAAAGAGEAPAACWRWSGSQPQATRRTEERSSAADACYGTHVTQHPPSPPCVPRAAVAGRALTRSP